MKSRVKRNLRVVFAIAGKDMVDAIKNKSILSQLFTLAFIIVLYKFLPSFENGDVLPKLALYDAGASKLVAGMEDSAAFDLVMTDSQAGMEAYVEDRDSVVLGLVIPSDFDFWVNSDERIELDGYVVHWASDSEVTETRNFFEGQLSDLIGAPIQIRVDGNIVYTRPDSRGLSFLVSLSAVLVMVIAGVFIVPLLMLEEKQSKTLDALLVSPADPGLIVLGKAFSGSIYCLIAAGVVLALNHTLVTQWGLAILTVVCGVFFSVSLGLLLGGIFEVKQQLTLWGFVLLNVFCIPLFLSMMEDILPAGVMMGIHAIPTVGLMKLFRVSFSNSAPMSILGPNLALVVGSTGFVLAAVIWVMRRSDR
jgi:ABC-type Na+ efflux pump permease subunit